MAIKAAELQVVIGADTSGAVSGIRSAMGTIGGMAQTALGVFTGQLLFNAVQRVGTAITGLARDAMQSTVSWEQLRFSLESLVATELRHSNSSLTMGQALQQAGGKASDLLQWIQKLAITSPFPTDTVASVFQMQMRMGATSGDAKTLTEALLNMGAATGLTTQDLYSAGLALSQISGSSKLSAQDLRQLINAGIPVNEILEKMGVNYEDVGKKAISSSDFVKTFINEANNYAGSIDRMQGSWTAMLGALTDVKSIGLRELFGGIFDALQPVVQSFTDWLLGEGMNRIKEIGQDLGDFAQKIVNIGQALFDAGPFSMEFNEALSALSPTLADLWEKASPFVQGVLTWITEHQAEVIGALQGMAIAFGALTVIGIIVALADPVTLAITGIIALAGVLGAAWTGNWLGIRDITNEVVTFLSSLISRFLSSIQGWWSAHGTQVTTTVTAIWDSIKNAFNVALEFIKSLVSQALTFIQGWWSQHGSSVQTIVSGTWNNIKVIISGLIEAIKVIVSVALAAIQAFWNAHGAEIMQIASTTWNAIKTIIGDIFNAIGFLLDAFAAAFKGDWEGFGEALKGLWTSLWDAIKTLAVAAWNNMKTIFSGIINDIKNAFHNVDWGQIGRDIINGIVNGIKAGISWIIQAAKDAAQAAVTAAKAALQSHSPSMVMFNLGENISKGMALGILSGVGTLQRSATVLAQAVPQTVNNYYLTAQYAYQSPTSLKDDVTLLQLLYGGR
jgi:tape measure domain-containing protein